MDLAGMKRRELQALCRRYGLPSGGTNVNLVSPTRRGLQALCKRHGLPYGGTVASLVARVDAALSAAATGTDDDDDDDEEVLSQATAAGTDEEEEVVDEGATSRMLKSCLKHRGRDAVSAKKVTFAAEEKKVLRLRSRVIWSPLVAKKTRKSAQVAIDSAAVAENGISAELSANAQVRRSRRNSMSAAEELGVSVAVDRKRKRNNQENDEGIAVSAEVGVPARVTRRSSLAVAAFVLPAAVEKKRGRGKAVCGSNKLGAESQVSARMTRSRATAPIVVSPIVVENKRRRKARDAQTNMELSKVSDVPRNDAPVTRTLRNRVIQVNSMADETQTARQLENKTQPSRPSTRRHQQVSSSVDDQNQEQIADPSKAPLLRRSRRNHSEDAEKQPATKGPIGRLRRKSFVSELHEKKKGLTADQNMEAHKGRSMRKPAIPVKDIKAAGEGIQNAKGKDVEKQFVAKQPTRRSSRKSVVPDMLQNNSGFVASEMHAEVNVRRSTQKSVLPNMLNEENQYHSEMARNKNPQSGKCQDVEMQQKVKVSCCSYNIVYTRRSRQSVAAVPHGEQSNGLHEEKMSKTNMRRSTRRSVVLNEDEKVSMDDTELVAREPERVGEEDLKLRKHKRSLLEISSSANDSWRKQQNTQIPNEKDNIGGAQETKRRRTSAPEEVVYVKEANNDIIIGEATEDAHKDTLDYKESSSRIQEFVQDNATREVQSMYTEPTITEENIRAADLGKCPSRHDKGNPLSTSLHLEGAGDDSSLPVLHADGCSLDGRRSSFDLELMFTEECKERYSRNVENTVVEIDGGNKPSTSVTPGFNVGSDCLEDEDVQPTGCDTVNKLDSDQGVAEEEVLAWEKCNVQHVTAKTGPKMKLNDELDGHGRELGCSITEKSTWLVADNLDEQVTIQVQQRDAQQGDLEKLSLCSVTPECKYECGLCEENTALEIGGGNKPGTPITPDFYVGSNCLEDEDVQPTGSGCDADMKHDLDQSVTEEVFAREKSNDHHVPAKTDLYKKLTDELACPATESGCNLDEQAVIEVQQVDVQEGDLMLMKPSPCSVKLEFKHKCGFPEATVLPRKNTRSLLSAKESPFGLQSLFLPENIDESMGSARFRTEDGFNDSIDCHVKSALKHTHVSEPLSHNDIEDGVPKSDDGMHTTQQDNGMEEANLDGGKVLSVYSLIAKHIKEVINSEDVACEGEGSIKLVHSEEIKTDINGPDDNSYGITDAVLSTALHIPNTHNYEICLGSNTGVLHQGHNDQCNDHTEERFVGTATLCPELENLYNSTLPTTRYKVWLATATTIPSTTTRSAMLQTSKGGSGLCLTRFACKPWTNDIIEDATTKYIESGIVRLADKERSDFKDAQLNSKMKGAKVVESGLYFNQDIGNILDSGSVAGEITPSDYSLSKDSAVEYRQEVLDVFTMKTSLDGSKCGQKIVCRVDAIENPSISSATSGYKHECVLSEEAVCTMKNYAGTCSSDHAELFMELQPLFSKGNIKESDPHGGLAFPNAENSGDDSINLEQRVKEHHGSDMSHLGSINLLDDLIGCSNSEELCQGQHIASEPCTNDIVEAAAAAAAKCIESELVLLPSEERSNLNDGQHNPKLESANIMGSGLKCDKEVLSTSDNGSVVVVVGERTPSGSGLPEDHTKDHYPRQEFLDGFSVESSLQGTIFGKKIVSRVAGTGNPSSCLTTCDSQYEGALSKEAVHRMKNYTGTCSADPNQLLMELQSLHSEGSTEKSDLQDNLAFSSAESCHVEKLVDTLVSSEPDTYQGPCQDLSRHEEKESCMSVPRQVEESGGFLRSSHTKGSLTSVQIDLADEAHLIERQSLYHRDIVDAVEVLCDEKVERKSMPTSDRDILEEKSYSNGYGICESHSQKHIVEANSRLSSCGTEVLHQDHKEECNEPNEGKFSPKAFVDNNTAEDAPNEGMKSSILLPFVAGMSEIPDEQLNTKMSDESVELNFSCDKVTSGNFCTGSPLPKDFHIDSCQKQEVPEVLSLPKSPEESAEFQCVGVSGSGPCQQHVNESTSMLVAYNIDDETLNQDHDEYNQNNEDQMTPGIRSSSVPEIVEIEQSEMELGLIPAAEQSVLLVPDEQLNNNPDGYEVNEQSCTNAKDILSLSDTEFLNREASILHKDDCTDLSSEDNHQNDLPALGSPQQSAYFQNDNDLGSIGSSESSRQRCIDELRAKLQSFKVSSTVRGSYIAMSAPRPKPGDSMSQSAITMLRNIENTTAVKAGHPVKRTADDKDSSRRALQPISGRPREH